MHFIRISEPYSIAIIFLLLYAAEHIFPARNNFLDIKHDLRNALIGVLTMIVIFAFGFYLQKIIASLNRKHFGFFYLISLPFVVSLVFQFLIIDLFMYWWHRANHTFIFLWQFHKLHHSDEKLNTTSALRFHAAEIFLSYIPRIVIFPLLGITVTSILFYSVAFLPIVVFHHSNIRISHSLDLMLRKIIVSPNMHRIHHSKITEETNSNYSSVFPWWDQFFRSYKKNPLKEIVFGLEK